MSAHLPLTPASFAAAPLPDPGSIRTLVAMPAHNEEAAIAKTVLGARRHADAVLVVDDGSTDETAAIAEALGAIVVRHETNRGYGGALQTIFSTARRLGVEELVIIDADGQHDPAEIPGLLAALREGNDVVIPDSTARSVPAAYARRAIDLIRPSGDGVDPGAEIMAQVRGMKVAEVPIRVRYDIEGVSSKNPVSHGIGVLMNIVRLISLRRPLVFFGVPGLFITLMGLGVELHTFSEYYRTAQFHYILFTGGFSMLILGLLLVAVGLILYSIVQIILQGQERAGRMVSDSGPTATFLHAKGSETTGDRAPHSVEGVPE